MKPKDLLYILVVLHDARDYIAHVNGIDTDFRKRTAFWAMREAFDLIREEHFY